MKTLTVILKDKVYFSSQELLRLNRTAYTGLLKLLQYKNDTYTENEKYGYSNWGVPPYIETYKIEGDRVGVFRGELEVMEEYLKKFKIDLIVVDKTVVTEPIDFSQSNTVLRPDQNTFLDRVAPFNNGVALAFTSFGKSVTVLEWVRILKQRTLILVHTTFLQKQWIMEATNNKLFNIDKKRIGGAGGQFSGKKFKLGDLNIALYHSAKKDEILAKYLKAGIGAIFIDEVQKAVITDIQKVVNTLPARYKYGVTAGLKRKDGKEFMVTASVGPVRYEAIETATDSKILSDICFINTPYRNRDYEDEAIYTSLLNDMAVNKERNIQICNIGVERVKRYGDVVIIFVERVIQAGILAKYLSKFRVGLLLGTVNMKKIEADVDLLRKVPKGVLDILRQYNAKTAYDMVKEAGDNRELDFVIGTQKMEVGLSIRTVSFGILTSPAGNNLERFNQILGRLERTHSDEQVKKFGVKLTPMLAVLVDNMIISRNAKNSIESKYGDRIKSKRGLTRKRVETKTNNVKQVRTRTRRTRTKD